MKINNRLYPETCYFNVRGYNSLLESILGKIEIVAILPLYLLGYQKTVGRKHSTYILVLRIYNLRWHSFKNLPFDVLQASEMSSHP